MTNNLLGLVFQCPPEVRIKIARELNTLGYEKDYTYTDAIVANNTKLLYNIEMYVDKLTAVAIKLKYGEYFLRNF